MSANNWSRYARTWLIDVCSLSVQLCTCMTQVGDHWSLIWTFLRCSAYLVSDSLKVLQLALVDIALDSGRIREWVNQTLPCTFKYKLHISINDIKVDDFSPLYNIFIYDTWMYNTSKHVNLFGPSIVKDNLSRYLV